jgi:hypothetical protein
MSYAVYHFFANGGTDAYIVRLAAPTAVPATATLGDLTVEAESPGVWANDVYGIRTRALAGATDRFGLDVVSIAAGREPIVVESFQNLSMLNTDRRSVETVINAESTLINARVDPAAIQSPGDIDNTPLTGGVDGPVLEPDNADFEAALIPVALGGGLPTGGIRNLDHVDLFNILCVPGQTTPAIIQSLQDYCRKRRAFLIVDSKSGAKRDSFPNDLNGLTGDDADHSALYFPWIKAPDPLQENRSREFPPSGFVAGVYARTDATRGVWKAPAGTEASLTGVTGVKVPLSDPDNGVLNPQAVNCIRTLRVYGTVVWGARTLDGNDERGSEWKYIPIRRLALFIEESLYRGTQWVVFEPNDEPLWGQIRLNIGAFMHNLFRQGAFQGKTPRDAYFVKCDADTTTQNDRNLGRVNIVVGFAPLKPAEFVIIQIQQMAGEIQV